MTTPRGDDWSVAWFDDPRCTNGYTWLVLDDGSVIELGDPALRTPHAGPCLTPRANSAYYGIAAATNGLVRATVAQMVAISDCVRAIVAFHRWPLEELHKRIVGHDAQAVWTRQHTPIARLWGKTGRKVDPTGLRPDRKPIIDVAHIRMEVSR